MLTNIGHITEFEPIYQTLQIASSNICARKRCQVDPDKCSPRVRRDVMLKEEIKRVWEEFLSLRKLERYGGNLTKRTFAWLR